MSVSICVTGRNPAKLSATRIPAGSIFFDSGNLLFLRLSGGALLVDGELSPMVYSGRELHCNRFANCRLAEGVATFKVNLKGPK